jgi:hypothetical protein
MLPFGGELGLRRARFDPVRLRPVTRQPAGVAVCALARPALCAGAACRCAVARRWRALSCGLRLRSRSPAGVVHLPACSVLVRVAIAAARWLIRRSCQDTTLP